ncbi:thiol-disulfide isomerase [Cenarchaeum symbiosum A]|uniref:Thiol-disulfide isomerase n=1 Tax=Cenarchaeum symbiosum (strain A) TaxID=414004 RepID=A0RUB2_CENSY|nr:thiol-disulfide isomerase [Cenarchaeum symbiosum A]
MVLMESAVSLKTGEQAPGFSLKGTDGAVHSLGDYSKYEGILVIFMCNHCPYVKAKLDTIISLHREFGDKIAIVGINSNDSIKYPDDSLENMKKVAAEKGIEFDYLVDETQEVAKSYGATCTPDPFLFDGEGKLIFHGRIDDAMKPEDKATDKTMAHNINDFLAGREIRKDFDPSIGCSIKWKD